MDNLVFQTFEEYKSEIKRKKAKKLLHQLVEKRLAYLLSKLYPDSRPVTEVSGILGGRNDLMQFFFNGRSVVFELFFSKSQVPQDLRLLEQSRADVKIAILLDPNIDSRLSDEYFRKKPDPFPFLWLRELMILKLEPVCLARLRELIDEHSAVRTLRRIMVTASGNQIVQSLAEQLKRIEERIGMKIGPPPSIKDLTTHQLASLMIIQEINKLGIPLDKLRQLHAWLQQSISFGFEVVSCGFQVFLITDLAGQHAIWSDGDLADDLILGADSRSHANVVICLNKIINNIYEMCGISRKTIRWNFFHTYCEHIGKIVPKWDLEKDENIGEP